MGSRASVCEEEDRRVENRNRLPAYQQVYDLRCLSLAKFVGAVQKGGGPPALYRPGHGEWVLECAVGGGVKAFNGHLTPFGHYEYNVLPFGIKNSPAECQRALDTVLADCEGVCRYIDDVVIYADTQAEHDGRLKQVLRHLGEGGFFPLLLKKTEAFVNEVNMLGHKISREGIRASPSKIEAICKLPPPANVKEMRGFLGWRDTYAHL